MFSSAQYQEEPSMQSIQFRMKQFHLRVKKNVALNTRNEGVILIWHNTTLKVLNHAMRPSQNRNYNVEILYFDVTSIKLCTEYLSPRTNGSNSQFSPLESFFFHFNSLAVKENPKRLIFRLSIRT
jgi:hypothetical protein